MTLTIEAHDAAYRINDPGGNIGKALRQGVPYEGPVLEHIYGRGFEGLAIDAGAHVGNHSLWLAAVCGLKVAAFEPLSYPDLLANTLLNPDLPITVHARGLGAEKKKLGNAGKGRLRGDGKIKVVPLDQFEFAGVSILKVDVEGMEAEVLQGGLDTIDRCRPVIYAECWDEEAKDRVADVLEPLGYRHLQTFGATPLLEWEPC